MTLLLMFLFWDYNYHPPYASQGKAQLPND